MDDQNAFLEPYRDRTATLDGLLSRYPDLQRIYDRMLYIHGRGTRPEATSREFANKLRPLIHRREEVEWLTREALMRVTGTCIDLDAGGPCR